MDDSTSLDRLHDIVVPPEVSVWPLAPGWWAVLIAICLLLGFAAYSAWKRWQANAYRRAALRELESATTLTAVATILRRCALIVTPRESIAAKSGNDWTSWLDATADVKMTAQVRQLLKTGPYSDQAQPPAVAQLRDYAVHWVRRHRRPEGKIDHSPEIFAA